MSMTVLAFALSAALAAPADDKKSDDAKAEMKKMEGTWAFEKIVRPGDQQVPEDELKQMKLEVKDDIRTVLRGGEAIVKSKYTIDPKASPKTIDVEIIDGMGKGNTLHGVYELDGDTFKVSIAIDGNPRPKKVEAGEGIVLQVFKRVKEEKKK
jgi:uncharacterized protein (TIGR03067 family)